MNTVHGNGRCHSVHRVIQSCAVLPFGKKTLSNQQPELGVAQPHGGQIRVGTASAGHQIETHYPVFAEITPRHVHASLVQAFEIVFADGWYGSAFFCRSDEVSKGLQPVTFFIRHLCHQLINGWPMPSSVAPKHDGSTARIEPGYVTPYGDTRQ
jgi:hypothetical protein